MADASLSNRENNVATLAIAGWSSTDLVNFITQAIAQGLATANLQAFIATAGAATAAIALISSWGSTNEVGRTVGWALTQAGNPTNAQLVQLLNFSQVHGWTGTAVRNATTAALCGPPNWYGFNQQNIAGNRVGINREFPTPYGPPGNLIWPTVVAQFYPLAGSQIVGRDLVAIGRLIGLI